MSHRFKTVLNDWEGEFASAWGSLRSCDLFIFIFPKESVEDPIWGRLMNLHCG